MKDGRAFPKSSLCRNCYRTILQSPGCPAYYIHEDGWTYCSLLFTGPLIGLDDDQKVVVFINPVTTIMSDDVAEPVEWDSTSEP